MCMYVCVCVCVCFINDTNNIIMDDSTLKNHQEQGINNHNIIYLIGGENIELINLL